MILVTGASGTLGRELLPRLTARGQAVRALSRRPRTSADGVEWAVGDLASGAGLDAAVEHVDTIVHAASDAKPAGSGDRAATERLLAAARRAGRRPHVVYMSIVGVDRNPFGYYRAKYACEQTLEASGIPHTILRSTQWYQLLDLGFSYMLKVPLVMPVPNVPVQPLDVSEVAARLAEIAVGAPLGRAEDMGGPEVLEAPEAAKQYADAAGKQRTIMPLWMPGKAGRAFRDGVCLAPEHRAGTMTWSEFLALRFRR
jgi:uncharacterized protein YbjT (DUF2867 family)